MQADRREALGGHRSTDRVRGLVVVQIHRRGALVPSTLPVEAMHAGPFPQAPVPAQVIDKGIPTAGLLAQVPTQSASRLEELLPHHWRSATA
jgi:hypothetical protein